MSSIGNNIPAQYTSIETVNSRRLRISFLRSPEAESTPWRFSCQYGQVEEFDHVQDIKLITCSITNTVPNVSSDQGNNVFALDFSMSGPLVVTLPSGFYSFNTLATLLQADINAHIAPSTAVFNLDPAGYASIVITGTETTKNSALSTLGNTLGYITLNAFTSTLIADVLPTLQGITYFHIHSERLAHSNCYVNDIDNQVHSAPCLFSVPVTADFGKQNVYQGSPLDRIIFGNNGGFSMRNFDIELRDETGRLLTDMDPRTVVEIIVKISF